MAVEGLERISARIGREHRRRGHARVHPEQYEIVSEGPRVELLAPPEVDLRFDDAPEALALSEDDAKADELDAEGEGEGEPVDDADDEPAAELAAEPAAEEPEPTPDLRDA